MIYEKYKQLFISHHFGGVRTMNIHKCWQTFRRNRTMKKITFTMTVMILVYGNLFAQDAGQGVRP
jgi:hypothetical protein